MFGSFCHFNGDEHTQREVNDHIQNREEGALDMTEFRAQPLDWLSISGTMSMQEAISFQNADGILHQII